MANYKLSTPCKTGAHRECAVRWKGQTKGGRESSYRCPCSCHPSIEGRREKELVNV